MVSEKIKQLAASYCNRVMDNKSDELTRGVESFGKPSLRSSCEYCYPTYGDAEDLFRACELYERSRNGSL